MWVRLPRGHGREHILLFWGGTFSGTGLQSVQDVIPCTEGEQRGKAHLQVEQRHPDAHLFGLLPVQIGMADYYLLKISRLLYLWLAAD